MSIDTKHDDLQSLRIDRSHRQDSQGEPPKWASRYILGGIAVVVLLGLVALVYRLLSPSPAEVEVVRAATEGGCGSVSIVDVGDQCSTSCRFRLRHAAVAD